MAVASTFSQHVVLVGLGHLGYRVAQHLHSMHQDVVAVEMNPSETLVADVRALNIPVIHDDGAREATLIAAGVRQARAIMLCTQQDSLNLQMAVKARSLNPAIQVVLRIFDDDFAESLHKQFGFKAFSATGMAAPAFAAACSSAWPFSEVEVQMVLGFQTRRNRIRQAIELIAAMTSTSSGPM